MKKSVHGSTRSPRTGWRRWKFKYLAVRPELVEGRSAIFSHTLSLLVMALMTASLAGSVFADEVKGKITKVGDEGREITVSTKDGKEVKVKISGSRTTIDGVKSRSDLKEGQSVTVEHEGRRPKK